MKTSNKTCSFCQFLFLHSSPLFFYFTTYKCFYGVKKPRDVSGDDGGGCESRQKEKRKKNFSIIRQRVRTKWDENPSDLVALVDGIGCCLVWKIAKVLKVNLTKINLKSSPNNKSHSLTDCMLSEVERKVHRISIKTRVAINLCVTYGGVKVLHRFSRRLTPSDNVVVSFIFEKFHWNFFSFSFFLPSIILTKSERKLHCSTRKNTFNDTKYARKAAQLPPSPLQRIKLLKTNNKRRRELPHPSGAFRHFLHSFTLPQSEILFSIFIPPHQKAKKTRLRERKINQQTITTSQNFLTHSTRTVVAAAGLCAEIYKKMKTE